MSTVIKVENISKQYRLGDIGTGSIRDDLNRWWHRVRGKEDPYLKIGETNDRSQKGNSDYVWALRDINFEVKQGEVLGIIGRNGAGKSTLLKILSKTTKPTTGNIKIKGRIASLLEVGTGFHPELSGRENIFLNGAILGMTKNEIKSKFDEIVDFSGVERYIDTPVKRYSSGMYVRLAFAVAAHLEPEILIVDEVLAVGDAEFQKKCLGKMKDVSVNDGRTVLFVSHNMPAVKLLCDSSILIKEGKIEMVGSVSKCIQYYFERKENRTIDISIAKYNAKKIQLYDLTINDERYYLSVLEDPRFTLKIKGEAFEDTYCDVEMKLKDTNGNSFAFFSTYITNGNLSFIKKGNFEMSFIVELPQNLNRVIFNIDFFLSLPGHELYISCDNLFQIEYIGTPTSSGKIYDASNGSGYLFV